MSYEHEFCCDFVVKQNTLPVCANTTMQWNVSSMSLVGMLYINSLLDTTHVLSFWNVQLFSKSNSLRLMDGSIQDLIVQIDLIKITGTNITSINTTPSVPPELKVWRSPEHQKTLSS